MGSCSDRVLTFHISSCQFSEEVTPESGLDLGCSSFLLIVRGAIHPGGWYCACALDATLVCNRTNSRDLCCRQGPMTDSLMQTERGLELEGFPREVHRQIIRIGEMKADTLQQAFHENLMTTKNASMRRLSDIEVRTLNQLWRRDKKTRNLWERKAKDLVCRSAFSYSHAPDRNSPYLMRFTFINDRSENSVEDYSNSTIYNSL